MGLFPELMEPLAPGEGIPNWWLITGEGRACWDVRGDGSGNNRGGVW